MLVHYFSPPPTHHGAGRSRPLSGSHRTRTHFSSPFLTRLHSLLVSFALTRHMHKLQSPNPATCSYESHTRRSAPIGSFELQPKGLRQHLLGRVKDVSRTHSPTLVIRREEFFTRAFRSQTNHDQRRTLGSAAERHPRVLRSVVTDVSRTTRFRVLIQ
jgi:hypothetical protein